MEIKFIKEIESRENTINELRKENLYLKEKMSKIKDAFEFDARPL
jgi:hypothetical protein